MTASILTGVDSDDLFAWLDQYGNKLLAEKASTLLALHMHCFEIDHRTNLPTDRALEASRAATDLRVHLAVYNLVSSLVDGS